MINIELLHLKDEFLKELREIETKLEKKIERNSTILEIKNQEQENKINLTIQKNEQIYDTMIEQKMKIEKISELYISQKKVNDMLMSHEMRINNLLTENRKLSKNYDKIITDNLTVPGYIGAKCPYKNLSEYILSNINDVSKMKIEKESDRKITEDFRNKLDNFIKNMLTLVDNTVTRCNQYTDNKQVYVENILNSKLVEFNEKNMDLRAQIFTNFSKLNNVVENFGLKLNELSNIKEELNKEINIKIEEIQNSFDENKININNNMEEIKTYKNTLIDLIDKKFEILTKNQKNIALSPNIKPFRGTVKRDTFNTKNIKNINKTKKEDEIRPRVFKRFTILNSKSKSKKIMFDTKEKEDNKLSFEFSEESSNTNDDKKNITNNNIVLKEESKEKENKEEEDREENKEIQDKIINKLKTDHLNEENKPKKEEIKNNNSNSKEKKSNDNEIKKSNVNNLDKALNSYYVNNIKTIRNKNEKNSEKDSNNDTIIVKEKKVKIQKISSNSNKNESNKFNSEGNSNENLIKKLFLDDNNNNKKKETSKSPNNSDNSIKVTKEKVKERFLKSINSEISIRNKKNLYNTSPQFYNSIDTQTPKLKKFFKYRAKFPQIGFSYKIINLGSNIDFKEKRLEIFQKKEENPKMNVDLSTPLTKTYKAYQKKKNDKKKNKKILLNELKLKGDIPKHKYILPIFTNTILNNNKSFYKKKYQSIDYEYFDLKRKKNNENEHSIESVKSTKNKKVKEKVYK